MTAVAVVLAGGRGTRSADPTRAKLAQEEILFKSKTQGYVDPDSRQALEDNYRRDVERITHERDRKIEKIRGA